MNSGTFMDIIGCHYKNIVSLFKSRSNAVEFDEDSFGDAFIKCVQRFGNEEISYEDAIRYFWVVYVNVCKNKFAYNTKHSTISIDDIDDIECESLDSIDIYNQTMDIIEKEFGEEYMMIYSLYKYYGWTEEDLQNEGYDCTNLKDKIKEIHKYIKSYYKINKKSS